MILAAYVQWFVLQPAELLFLAQMHLSETFLTNAVAQPDQTGLGAEDDGLSG